MFSNQLRNRGYRLAAAAAMSTTTSWSMGDATPVSEAQAATTPNKKHDQKNNEEALFENQCLQRQLHQPKVPYPAWDYNWDGRMTPETSLEGHRNGTNRNVRGKTRHILLVRHGQYDETSTEDVNRKLTPLGRIQAIKTGRRLAELLRGSETFPRKRFRGRCVLRAIRVSNMTRAKETADLITAQLPDDLLDKDTVVQPPDASLNEALPAPMIPIRPDIEGATEEIDEHGDRIEQAFQKYFWRDSILEDEPTDDDEEDDDDDEFEIIVCHGNVIRYFFCRALQLPPEAWLRFSIFNCSITYLMMRPSGTVSARMLGDVGHLPYEESTFSGYHGFKW